MELIRRVFNLIGQTADELNCVFSSMTLFLVSTRIINFILYLFIVSTCVLYEIMGSGTFLKLVSFTFSIESIYLSNLVTAAEAPVSEVHSFHLLRVIDFRK